VIVFQKEQDVFFSLICDADENELIAGGALQALVQAIKTNLTFAILTPVAVLPPSILRATACSDCSKSNLLYRYNELLLILDAVIDNGCAWNISSMPHPFHVPSLLSLESSLMMILPAFLNDLPSNKNMVL
jgi:hypothetical protein